MHQRTFKMNVESTENMKKTEEEINEYLAEVSEVGGRVEREIIEVRYNDSLKHIIFSFLCGSNASPSAGKII